MNRRSDVVKGIMRRFMGVTVLRRYLIQFERVLTITPPMARQLRWGREALLLGLRASRRIGSFRSCS